MSIATRCPHCETSYSLKDELGGKRVTCKNCRKVFPVPAATPNVNGVVVAKPALDAEQLALAALSEAAPEAAKKPEAAVEQAKITVKCQHCDFENAFEARMAGKNAPCQNEECRKIIKVPALVKADPKDWRNVAQRPTLAKVDHADLEGAWGNVQTQAVSREAIVQAEADRIEEVEPVSWGKRIVYALAAIGVLLIVFAGVSWGLRKYSEGKQDRAIQSALEYVNNDPKSKTPKLKKELAGLVYLLAGQYEFGRNNAKAARENLVNARRDLNQGAGNSPERCAGLIEVAVGLAELAGAKPEVDAGTRLDWEKDKLNSEVRSTLTMLPSSANQDFRDMRAYAFRRLARTMGKGERLSAIGALAANVPDDERSEIWAVVGLELLALGQREEAEKLANQSSKGRKEGASSLIALWLAIGSPDASEEKKKNALKMAAAVAPIPASKDAVMSPLARIGYAEGWARQGNLTKAREYAWSGKPEDRLRAGAALAEVVLGVGGGEMADLEKCAQLLDGELKNKAVSGWLLMRLVELSLRANRPELAGKFAVAIADSGLRSWANYEALRARLKSLDKQSADWKEAADVGGPERFGHWMAWTALARHNASANGGAGVMKEIKGWDDSQKPFGYCGVALAER
jgi:predicted Zn finger-like uncharacterized protein